MKVIWVSNYFWDAPSIAWLAYVLYNFSGNVYSSVSTFIFRIFTEPATKNSLDFLSLFLNPKSTVRQWMPLTIAESFNVSFWSTSRIEISKLCPHLETTEECSQPYEGTFPLNFTRTERHPEIVPTDDDKIVLLSQLCASHYVHGAPMGPVTSVIIVIQSWNCAGTSLGPICTHGRHYPSTG